MRREDLHEFGCLRGASAQPHEVGADLQAIEHGVVGQEMCHGVNQPGHFDLLAQMVAQLIELIVGLADLVTLQHNPFGLFLQGDERLLGVLRFLAREHHRTDGQGKQHQHQ